MFIPKKAVRNREIFAAYQNGNSAADLANRYGLSTVTIREILRIERHKVAVSADQFYEEMRSRNLRTQS